MEKTFDFIAGLNQEGKLLKFAYPSESSTLTFDYLFDNSVGELLIFCDSYEEAKELLNKYKSK